LNTLKLIVTITIKNQKYVIPITPKPRNQTYDLGSPGHLQILPVLIIRAIIGRLKNKLIIMIATTAAL
jgi:hypothetical protein